MRLEVLALALLAAFLGALALSAGASSTRRLPPQPDLQLPWAQGEAWIYVGGPHNTNGCPDGGFVCRGGHPWSSLDFSTRGAGIVEAAAAGTVEPTHACPAHSNFLILDNGGGWHTTYYHLIDIRVHAGERVRAGQPLGLISELHGCGGHAEGAHVHFSVDYYTGGYHWRSGGVDLEGLRIGEWIFHDGPTQYAGCATNAVTSRRVCPGGRLTNGGAPAPSDCPDSGAFTAIRVTAVSCGEADRVLGRWESGQGEASGCGPSGSPCEVLGFRCEVPAADNYNHLICTDGARRIVAKLGPY